MPTMPAAAKLIGLPPTMASASVGIATAPPPMPSARPPTAPATLDSKAAELSPSIMPTIAGDAAAAAAAPPPSMPPARYELGAEIARGGMGRVVEATDTLLGRVVALKEVLAGDTDTLQRFARETRITARLEHPSIVPLHDAGAMPGGAPYYVMRKISGRPLERLVALADTLDQRLVLVPHIVAAAQAIAHAHERGVVHRDIKPSNILVGELGETIVIDWGLAKVIGEPEDARPDPSASLTVVPPLDDTDTIQTRAGIVFGTPGFMAPEQLRGKPVTEQCDVYALGATLYHLLSRKPPHYSKSADEMMKAAASRPPPPIAELVPGVPAELATIVDKSLAHDPAARYAHARALAEDLQRFLSGQLVRSHHYSWRERLTRFIRKNRVAVSIVAAAISFAIVVGALSIVRVIGERDRADAAARSESAQRKIADDQRGKAEQRAEQLTLAAARRDAVLDPTRAIALLRPVAAQYWREARSIAAAAAAHGVARGMPVPPRLRTLALSSAGTHALAAGGGGALRLYDLAKRTSRAIPIAIAEGASARFADADRRIVAWHDRSLLVIDAATGAARTLTAPAPITALETAGAAAYWTDDAGALWQLDTAGGGEPAPIDLPERAVAVHPSPDGRFLAVGGDAHLLIVDLEKPAAAPRALRNGALRAFSWSTDGVSFAALVDQDAVFGVIAPAPRVLWFAYAGSRRAVLALGDRLYIAGATGVAVIAREAHEGGARAQLIGASIGFAEARGGSLVAAGRGGLTILSPLGDHKLPSPAGALLAAAASPRAPYVVAAAEDQLLLWNLDEIEPRRLVPVAVSFHQLVGAGQAIVTVGDDDIRWLDLSTGKLTPLAEGRLRAVAGSPAGDLACAIDEEESATLLAPDREPLELAGHHDLAAFAGPDRLVLAHRATGTVHLYDARAAKLTPLLAGKGPLRGLAVHAGDPAWVVVALADGALWRKDLATGAESTAAAPPGGRPPPDSAPALLQITGDGRALVGDGRVLRAWAPGAPAPIALRELPRPLLALELTGPGHALTVLEDSSAHVVDLSTGAAVKLEILSGQLAARQGRIPLAVAAAPGVLAAPIGGGVELVDPIARLRWTLGPQPPLDPAETMTFSYQAPLISADGTRVLARLPDALVGWSIRVPADAAATAAWLDELTNASIDSGASGALVWR